jgi:hypothetical protein
MRLARMKSATAADLPLRDALKAIANPSRYVLTKPCCSEEVPAPCNCGADYLFYVDGELVGRITPRRV